MKQGFKQTTRLRRGLSAALLWPLAWGAAAQQVPAALPPDTTRQIVDLQVLPDSLAAAPAEESVDSARLVWLQTPPTLREVVADRIGCFETDAPHQFNNSVMAYVRLFTERQRGYTQRVLEREQFYFPIFEKYLNQYGLPTDLKYLAVVESALIPTAKSHVGATGLWQFMGPTAGDLRLRRDEWVDERMHPEKATEAACKHLRYLYGIFHDWELVLAAYNWGAGSVQRVMRRSGKKNFWDLYPYMPAETRNYVPTFTAIMYTLKHSQQHGLHNPQLRYWQAEPLDTLGLRGQPVDLRRLSRALGYPDSLALARFNPEVRRLMLPAGYRPYVLRYPAAAAREHLGDVDRNTLIAYCQPAAELPRPLAPLFARLSGVEPFPVRADLLAANAAPRADSDATRPRFRRVYHTVRRGQTVATVAEKFDVSPAKVRQWNALAKGRPLRPGRELVLFVPLPALAKPVAAPVVALAAPALPAGPRRPLPDSAAAALAAANARYAREAQLAAARETAQNQALLRLQKAQAARVAAQQRQAVFRAAEAAKAAQVASAAEKASKTASRPVVADLLPTATPETAATGASTDAAVALAAEATTESAAPVVLVPVAVKAPAKATVLYTVQPGDHLATLAHAHGASVAQVKAWNNLNSETVLPGQRLRLVAPADAVEGAAAPTPARSTIARSAKPETRSSKLETHTVQRGDTLFNISRRFNMSVQELRRLNHLTSDEVKLGQKLVVKA